MKSNCLASALREAGVRRRDRVGIYMHKCLESAVALYGIMKAGAAYVPVDPTSPVERVHFVARDCAMRFLIADERKAVELEQLGRDGAIDCVIGVAARHASPITCLPWQEVWAQPGGAAPAIGTIEQDLAYIIYTSGSTGTPKGIMHTHRSGLSFANWAAQAYGLTGDDRLTNHAPLHFDLSIFDFFAGAVAGATTVIVPEAVTKFPASYSQLLQDEAISVFFTVPFALIQLESHGVLDERDLSALRWVIFGGEPFPPKYLRALMEKIPSAQFDNMYGPAEVNGCTHYTIPRSEPLPDTPVPIGTMNANMEGIVVDGDDREVHPGDAGELLVRSPTMMQGYWGRPDLNATAFYRREIAVDYADVYYRTGDLVQLDDSGNLQFLGRKDRQVKIRGYRVELDEVESALASYAGVEEAGAFTVPDGAGSSRIEAVVTLHAGASPATGELLAHAKSRLAWYAVPATVTVLSALPRTSTGKIDRRQLQATAAARPGHPVPAHLSTNSQ